MKKSARNDRTSTLTPTPCRSPGHIGFVLQNKGGHRFSAFSGSRKGVKAEDPRPKGGERSLREISRELAADISMSAGGRSRLTASAICWAMS
jgi:hypothetical protein